MGNFKKLWLIIPMVFLLAIACNSKNDEAEKVKEGVGTETKNEAPYDVKTGVFQSKDGNFSINIPGEPEFSPEPVDFGGGVSVTMNTFTYTEGKNKIFMIAYSDFPLNAALKTEEARVVLKDEQEGALGSFGVKKPDEEKQSDYEGYPGLFYKAKTPEGYYVVVQTYLIGKRLYQIEMLTAGNYPSQQEIQAFNGSFKLLK